MKKPYREKIEELKNDVRNHLRTRASVALDAIHLAEELLEEKNLLEEQLMEDLTRP